jgi:CheY-like chemotaxis protein
MFILVVDDNPANRRLLSQMLQHIGHETFEADDGLSAIEAVQQYNFDMIFMDIMMPGMNGHEATRKIKGICGDNHIPVIFVTALKNEYALKESLEAGGDDFINKPIDFSILESKTHAHSRIRELNQQLLAKNIQLISHNNQLTREHELISYFFDNALARSFLDPQCIRHYFSPMAAFNGDVMLSKLSPSGGLYLLLGDFTGHGLAAAMGTLPVAQRFFELTEKGITIDGLAFGINRTLLELLPDDLFFTAIIAELSNNGLRLSVWNGGMPDAVIIPDNSSKLVTIPSQHMPLGILEDHEFDSTPAHYQLEPGDRLFLYTDGIIETMDSSGEMFGEERLHQTLMSKDEQLIANIQAEVAEFRGNPDQQDDISLVEVLCDQIPNKSTDSTTEEDKPCIPWKFSAILSAEEIHHTQPVGIIVNTLESAIKLGHHKGIVHTLISELYNNAVEHGVLGLEYCSRHDDEQFVEYYNAREEALDALKEAKIEISIRFAQENSRGILHIRVKDSGNSSISYNLEEELLKEKTIKADIAHGRGLMILSELCEKLTFDNETHTAEVRYLLD